MTRIPLGRLRPAARLGVAFVIAVLALLTLAQRASPLSPWWLELTRYLPYPLLLAPVAVALLVSCVLGWRWVLASAAALALAATLTMGLVWSAPEVGPSPFRVMTYNIKGAKAAQRSGGLAELAREIARHDPDIVLVQDAQGMSSGLPGPQTPQALLFAGRALYRAGQYVIASRFPLRDCAPGRLPVRGEDAGYLRCVVDVRGVELTLVSVHFESPRNGLNAARREGVDGIAEWRRNYADRLDQARVLAATFAAGPRPLVIAGDLNAPQASPVVRTLLATGLRDAFASAGRGYGYSYGQALRVGLSFLRIDHILVSDEIGVSACEVGDGAPSEHRPVVADLWLRRPS